MPSWFPATAIDPDGATVELTAERWRHITSGHPELAPLVDLVLRAVEAPDRRLPGRREGEAWFYLRTVAPSRWLKVVVRYDATGRAWIVTAFARRSLP